MSTTVGPDQRREEIELVFEYGRVWVLEELPPRSIALDGAVQGPQIDAVGRRYSFDHHEGCIRHATLSCCEQVYDALRVGLDPRGVRVYLNDVDTDSALGAWLLLHREEIDGDESERLEAMVRQVGRYDALGPAVGEAPELMHLLDYRSGQDQSRETLDDALELIDAWWRGEPLATPPLERENEALWIEQGRVVRGWVEGGFRSLYPRVGFGVLVTPAASGTTAYTVGKASDFVSFDVRLFLERCAELEPGWGGGSTIGGAPRHGDGSRSRLTVRQVSTILEEVWAQSR